MAKFIATKAVNPFVPPELAEVITSPIKFRPPGGGIAYGYEATVLADLCDVVLDARKRGKLNYQQEHIARTSQCRSLTTWAKKASSHPAPPHEPRRKFFLSNTLRDQYRAFTLVELLVAITVVGLLLALLSKIDNIQVELPISINYEAPEQTKESNHNPANGQNPSKLTAGRTVCKMLKFAALFIVGLVSLGLAVESMDRKDWAEWRRVAVSMACFAICVVACYGFVLNFR